MSSLMFVFAALCTAASSAEPGPHEPAHGSRQADLFLVAQGKPVCTVLLPSEASEWEKRAAGWLRDYVHRASGARLPLAQEPANPEGTIIAVGHTARAAEAGIELDMIRYDGCRLVVRGSTLHLIGRDTPGLAARQSKHTGEALDETDLAMTNDKRAQGAKGTCRAVTKFLEDYAGVRWFLPAEAGEVVPERATLTVPRDLDVIFNPAFAYAHGRYIYGDGPASYANNFRTSLLLRGYGGHSYYQWVPAEEYGEKHPEYFRMDEQGNRISEGNHLCTSNPEVRELFREGLFSEFEKGFDWVGCGQTDGFRRCQCAACEALDLYRGTDAYRQGQTVGSGREHMVRSLLEHPCERLHLTHKWLIDEAAEAYPGRKVHLIAYGPTTTPSKLFDYYGDNVIVEVCGDGDPRSSTSANQIINLWKRKAAGITVYVCWFDITLWKGLDQGLTPEEASGCVRHLHDHEAVGIYFGGGGSNWGFMGPAYYVFGKMMGDPSLDYRELVREYCDGLYGAASHSMQEFFELLEHPVTAPMLMSAEFGDRQLLRYPPRLMEKLNAKLAEAERLADTGRSRNLLVMTRDQLDHNILLTRAIMAYRWWRTEPTAANEAAVARAVKAYDAFRERVIHRGDEFAERYFPGYANFCNFLTSNAEYKVYYQSWSERSDEIRSKPIQRMGIGYPAASSVTEPLTLDFEAGSLNGGQ